MPTHRRGIQRIGKWDGTLVLPWGGKEKQKSMLALIEEKIHEGIHRYYVEAMERKKHAGESMEAGREYVQAYVPYLHFVERLYVDATTPIAHGAGDVGGGSGRHPEPAPAGKHAHSAPRRENP